MKDPAFLFYPNDYLGGTTGMTLEEKGAYMELLVMQFNKGAFTEIQAKKLLNGAFDRVWVDLKEKFIELDGKFFNKRLEEEKVKRKNNAEKNKERIDKYWAKKKNENTAGKTNVYTELIPNSELPIENEVENENENENKKGVEKVFLIPTMQKIFKKHVKNYSLDQNRDFEPLQSIAAFVSQQNQSGDITHNQPKILAVWEQLSLWISKDNFYSQKSLKTISNHIQEIYTKQKNGTNSNNRNTEEVRYGSNTSQDDYATGF